MSIVRHRVKVLGREVWCHYDTDTEEIHDLTMDLGCGRVYDVDPRDLDPEEWRMMRSKVEYEEKTRLDEKRLARSWRSF